MNGKKYWMKRRRYGWGWTPTTWQAWLFVISQIIIVLLAALGLVFTKGQPSLGQLLVSLAIILLAVLTLVIVSSQTAPKPHFRWGKKDTDNPDEDF